ncbi:uncharacterized protein LOC126734233 [Anthonomus grandis grandis]|uniref:uncharacterized protein LOC126734233 n=1 Tax=Anthonomus grandis grandis TaxID=2921223 RepID=UPI0021664494|nr:uncharacterized protein LOC126734233 [Anthonomus grandis grandis]
MKKYQRLLLIIISIISLSLFLVYRHQYNRLRHVLEVFNFFGTPCNISELHRSPGVLLEHDWGPQPVWQEVDSKGFIYSAFLVENHKVQGLGVRHASVAIPKSCFLFFEDDPKPIKGKLGVSKVAEDKTSGFLVYVFTCVFGDADNRSPYSVAFKSQSGPKYVTTLVTNALDKRGIFNGTICAAPGLFSKKMLLEFLSFHSFMGIESFIIYHEQNLPHRVLKLLKNFSNNLNLWLTFYPYNLPLFIPKQFTKILLEYDCLLRTKSQSKFSLVLNLNEYIVPSGDQKKHKNMRLPIKQFCISHVSKNRPIVLQNYEVLDNHSFNEVVQLNVNNFNTSMGSNIRTIFDNNCVIFRYEKCEKGAKTLPDFSMKRFSTDLTRSTLVQLLIHDDV